MARQFVIETKWQREFEFDSIPSNTINTHFAVIRIGNGFVNEYS